MKSISTKLTLHNLALEDGTYQVRLQAIYQRKRKTIPTGYHLTKSEFEFMFPKVQGKIRRLSVESQEIKNELIKIWDKSHRIVNEIQPFSLEEWKRRMLQSNSHSDSVALLFDQKIKELEQQERKGTSRLYGYSLKKLSKFWLDNVNEPLTLRNLTYARIVQFNDWMIESGIQPEGYMRLIKAIYNEAIALNIVEVGSSPFGNVKGKYSIPAGNNPKLALPKSVISAIESLQLREDSKQYYYRNMWLLCYYMQGINISDLLRLRESDMTNGIISFIRKKTERLAKGRKVVIYVNEKAMRLIEKYRGNDQHLLNILERNMTEDEVRCKITSFTSMMKYYMNKVAKQIGFNGTISYLHSRHSFATIAREHMPDSVVGQALGHRSLQSTQNYFARYGNKTLAQLHRSMF